MQKNSSTLLLAGENSSPSIIFCNHATFEKFSCWTIYDQTLYMISVQYYLRLLALRNMSNELSVMP